MKNNIVMYHNPACSTCRKALELLEEKGQNVQTYDYLKTPPTAEDLKKVLQKLGMKPEALIRKKEAIYKEQYAGKTLSDQEWIDVMVQYPKLIERPIVINKDQAVVARPIEKILDIL